MLQTITKPIFNHDLLSYPTIIFDSVSYNYPLKQVPLEPIYSTRKSFYGKATVITPNCTTGFWKGVRSVLKSYDTIVAIYLENGDFFITKKYSPTTTSHQVEFAKQCGLTDITSQSISAYKLPEDL